MRVHYRSFRIGVFIGLVLMIPLFSVLPVNLHTRNANRTRVSVVTGQSVNQIPQKPKRPPASVNQLPPRKGTGTTPDQSKTATPPPPQAGTNSPTPDKSQTDTKPTPDANVGKKPSKATNPASTQTVSPPRNVDPQTADPNPQQVPLKLSVTKNLIQLGETVTFTVDTVSHYSFEFNLQDGTTKTTSGVYPKVDYQFAAAGTYNVSVRPIAPLGVPAPTLTIDPVTVTVKQVTLTPDPDSVEVGIPIKFTAVSVSTDPNLRYHFIFGDGKETAWQESKEVNHAYPNAQSYQPKVEVGFAQKDGSDPVSMDSNTSKVVQIAPSTDRLDFDANPSQVKEREPVTLSVRPFPAKGRQIQYRFVFDQDQKSDWSDDVQMIHVYGPGIHHPSAEVGVVLDGQVYTLATAIPRTIDVIGVPPNPKWPWFVIAAILILTGCFVGYQVVSYLIPPKPSFVPQMGILSPTVVQNNGGPLISFELDVDPNLSGGFYDLITSEPRLIRAERSHQ